VISYNIQKIGATCWNRGGMVVGRQVYVYVAATLTPIAIKS